MIERYLPRQDFADYDEMKREYRVTIPDGFNFAYDIVDGWAAEQPDKLALIWCNDHGEERRYSFADMKALSDRAANAFAAAGIGAGDAVLLMLKQRPEVWIAMLALCKLGAICIPGTYQLTAKDIAYRVQAAHARAIVAVDDNDIPQHVDEAMPHTTGVRARFYVGEGAAPEGWRDLRRDIREASDAFERPTGDRAARMTDPMLIYFSSGTTGMPKMVWHDFTYPLGHIVTAKYWHRVQDGGLHLTVSDSGWAKFGWGKIYGQWICGAVIVAYDTEKFVPANMLAVIDRYPLTTFCAPPTIYRYLIKEDLSRTNFSTIRHCTTAGEPLNPEVYHQFKQATGLAITEGFGQSETTVLIANFPGQEVKPGSMGKPSPLYDVDIVDENGNSCEDGIVGNIVVRNTDERHPTGLFRGYYLDEARTRECWHDGVYNTGDTAWRDGDGYYWFVGRSDDVIKCSGYRIGPFEVESALQEHPAVLECAVTAVPDPLRGQVVKATIVLARGYEASDALTKELQNHVKRVTAPYKYPRVVEYVTELPKTVSGKIRRVAIRDADQG